MELREWLFRNRVTQTELAKCVGVTKQYVHYLCHGKYRASSKLALRIEEYTKGGVTAEEMLLPEKHKERE